MMAEFNNSQVRDLNLAVLNQLPEQIRGKVDVAVMRDPMQYNVVARIHETAGDRVFQVHLEEIEIHGVPVVCKLPDAAISQLCMEIR